LLQLRPQLLLILREDKNRMISDGVLVP